MGKLWCNEELAARAKAGNKEAFALLWAKNRRHIYYLAVKYRSIIEQNAFVDLDDFMQCGYLALVEAVNAFDPEKGFALTSYINFKYKQQVHAMFGNVREGDKHIFPQPCSSLNAIIENDKDGSGTEAGDLIEGESAEEFDERIEKKELCEIVRAAVDRLPEREAFVIRRLYFDDYTKRALASGGCFKDENEVARIENAAMLKLRRDETLKALHYAHFPDDPQDVFAHSPTPLNVVIAAENWEEWIERAAEELRGLENGL